jgi:hypothetical protein
VTQGADLARLASHPNRAGTVVGMTTSHGDGDQEIYGDYSVDDEDQPGNI